MTHPDQTPRDAVEQRSAFPLAYLASLPKWFVFLVVGALVVAGLFFGTALGGLVGFVCLGILGLLLGWLAYLSWPSLDAAGRVVRVLSTAIVLGVAVSYLVR